MPFHSRQTLRRILALATLTLLSATLALAQDQQSGDPDFSRKGTDNWSYAQSIGFSDKKLFVVTITDPTHRHPCRVQSFTADQLTCKGLGASFYRPQDIAALIIPGDFATRVRFAIGFSGAAAAATWGTIVLAATCTPCAVGVGIVAFVLVVADLGTQAADPVEDSLLYLAPGQTLHVDLRY